MTKPTDGAMDGACVMTVLGLLVIAEVLRSKLGDSV